MRHDYKWRKVCRCDGLDFPHRRGSKGCYDSKNIDDVEELEARHGVPDQPETDVELAESNGYTL